MVSFDMSKHEIEHIHLVGIGGISMSAIAEILLKHDYRVSGSDMNYSPIIGKLENNGAKIFIGHDRENIQNPDLVVYTAAVKEDNPEIIRAKELGIPLLDRAEMLGQIMKKYNKSIAVAGSHGKTTTTSFLSLLLEYADLDPTILVGGELDDIGGNIKIGKSEHFITEACEYVESFLKFNPFIAIILNIDEDHLDYFKDIEHIKNAFLKFAKKVPKEGFVIACTDDIHVVDICQDLKCKVITYGVNAEADFMARNIIFTEQGFPSFDVIYRGAFLGTVSLCVPGDHNVFNALASIATAFVLGINVPTIIKNISRFKGIHRRFELLGEVKGAKIIDDYAHHPVEVKATLNAAQKLPHNKVYCVFQPHTFTRTKAFLDEFSKSFSLVDHLIITDIYAAREKDLGEVSSEILAERIAKNRQVEYMKGFNEIADYLYDIIAPNDLIFTMGAGNVDEIGKLLLNKAFERK